MSTEWVPIETLKTWDKNPRRNARAVPKVAESIRRYGFVAPVVAWESQRRLVAGHTRLAALASILTRDPAFVPRGAPGPGLVLVHFHEFNTEQEANAYAVADNKLNEVADWDEELLEEVMSELRELEASSLDDLASLTGFELPDLEHLFKDSDKKEQQEDPGAEVDKAAELQKKWGTAPGQLWEISSATVPGRAHRLLCGDSRRTEDALRVMGGDKARWCWTDPPYGVEYQGGTADHLRIQNDGAKDLPELLRCSFAATDAVLTEGAPIYVAHPSKGTLFLEFGSAFRDVGWHLHQSLIWVKDAMVLGRSDYHYQHEPLLYGWKGKNRSWYGGRDKVSTRAVPRPDRSELHPTMKPPGLVAMCLQNSSRAGDLGFEPFSGSGTTLVAAEQTGRLCCGIEIDPKYVAVALERLSKMGLQPRLAAAPKPKTKSKKAAAAVALLLLILGSWLALRSVPVQIVARAPATDGGTQDGGVQKRRRRKMPPLEDPIHDVQVPTGARLNSWGSCLGSPSDPPECERLMQLLATPDEQEQLRDERSTP